jgi:hypothetical protein
MQVLSEDGRVTIDITYKSGIANSLALEWLNPDQRVAQVAEHLRQGSAQWYVEDGKLMLVCDALGVTHTWSLGSVQARGAEIGFVGIDPTEFEVRQRENHIHIH